MTTTPGSRSMRSRALAGAALTVALVAGVLGLGPAAPASAATATGYGKSVLGTISAAGEKDAFTFAGAAGDRLSFDVLKDDFGLVAKLAAPNGLVIWNNVDFADRVEALPQSGTYTLTVSYGSSSYTGSYGFALANVKNPQSFSRSYGAVVGPTVPSAFTSGPAVAINGTYTPLAGNFDGDAYSDVFWYGPGTGAEGMTFGGSGGALTGVAVPGIGVNGTYRPVVADFTGDGRSDIFWYAPGSGSELLWKGASNVRTAGFTKTTARAVNGTYTPLAGDFNADGKQDIYWYGPGSAADFLWFGNGAGGFTDGPSFAVTGTYVLTAGNFDGVAGTDVLFYSPTTGATYLWWSRGGRIVDSHKTIASPGKSARPVAGDFDGNGRTDVLFYRPGTASDSVRRGDPTAGLVPGEAATINGTYTPVPGDFSGDKKGDVLLYGPGTAADSMLLGRTPEPKGAGEIEVPGASDQYSFSGTSGDRLSIDVLDDDFGLVMTLTAPNGLVVWNNVDFADRFVDLTQTGTWKLKLSYGSNVYVGQYRFSFANVKTPQSFAAPYKTTVGLNAPGAGAGTIHLPGAADQFTFSGTSGDRLSIDVLDDDFGLVMTLTAPNGLVVWNNVDFADRFVDLTQTGTWKLKLSYGSNPYTGGYSFQINNVKNPQAFSLSYGKTVGIGYPGAGAGQIELPGASDTYSFSGSSGQSVTVDWLATEFGLIVRLVAPDGTVVWNDLGASDRTLTLNKTGTWKLKVSFGSNPYTGDYSFSLIKN